MLKPFSYDLYRELLKHGVVLELRLAEYKNKITIATGRDCFVRCQGVGDSQFQIHYSNETKSKDLLYNAYQGEQNPVVIKGVPSAVLTGSHTIQAYIIGQGFEEKVAETKLNPSATQGALSASRAEKQQAFNSLEIGVFRYIKDSIEIELLNVDINPKSSGLYDAHITVKWDVKNKNRIKHLLNRYFNLENSGGSLTGRPVNMVEINEFNNKNERQKRPYTWDLYNQLLRYKAEIVVKIGNKSERITLATGRSCFVRCKSGFGKDRYQLQLSNAGSVSKLLYSAYQGEQNPVIIESLTESELKEGVSAHFEWQKRD